jgi:hypothetical protein
MCVCVFAIALSIWLDTCIYIHTGISWSRSVFLGFSTAMLGTSGFESSSQVRLCELRMKACLYE